MTPLVSILIPCHNAAPWLAATLDSALAQTYPQIEIIVVDDGSTDDSASIAERYTDRGIKLIRQSQRGAAAARNTAARYSRGALLQWLDADDLLSPDKIAAQVSRLENAPPGSVASCRWGRFRDDPASTRFADAGIERDFTPVDYLLAHTRDQATMHPAAWLVPRDVADRAGPWDESLTLNDDGEFFARVVLASAGIAFAPGPVTHYRSGAGATLSGRRSRTALESLARSVELVSSHLLRKEDSPRVRAALADYHQRLVYEIYPEAADLIPKAEARVRELGGSQVPPPLGRRVQWVARLLGWRLARRLHLWQRGHSTPWH